MREKNILHFIHSSASGKLHFSHIAPSHAKPNHTLGYGGWQNKNWTLYKPRGLKPKKHLFSEHGRRSDESARSQPM